MIGTSLASFYFFSCHLRFGYRLNKVPLQLVGVRGKITAYRDLVGAHMVEGLQPEIGKLVITGRGLEAGATAEICARDCNSWRASSDCRF